MDDLELMDSSLTSSDSSDGVHFSDSSDIRDEDDYKAFDDVEHFFEDVILDRTPLRHGRSVVRANVNLVDEVMTRQMHGSSCLKWKRRQRQAVSADHCSVPTRVEDSFRWLGKQNAYDAKSLAQVSCGPLLGLDCQLAGHIGCVNALNFSRDGQLLVSGSDDTRLIIWPAARLNERQGKPVATNHHANIFQCKFLPFANSHIVTSGQDGQIYHIVMRESGECGHSRLLNGSVGLPVHKLALNYGNSPFVFLSADEQGIVNTYDVRQYPDGDGSVSDIGVALVDVYSKPTRLSRENPTSLFSVDVNPMIPHQFCLAGEDEWIRVVDGRHLRCRPTRSNPSNVASVTSPVNGTAVRNLADCNMIRAFCPSKFMPVKSTRPASSGVESINFDSPVWPKSGQSGSATCAVYSQRGSYILASYRADKVYLFDNASDVEVDSEIQSYGGHVNVNTIKGVKFYGPNDEYVVSGSDCGRIFFWDTLSGQIVKIINSADSRGATNVLESHPIVPIFATAGLDHTVKIWQPSRLEAEEFDIDEMEMIVRRNAVDVIGGVCRMLIPDHLALTTVFENGSFDGSFSDSSRSDWHSPSFFLADIDSD